MKELDGLFCGVGLPPVLDERQIQEYLIMCSNGNREAREALIKHNLRLAVYIAKGYLNNCDGLKIEFEDLVMYGTLGLIKGIDTYNFSKNNKISTYISRCINNEILMYLRKVRKIKPYISYDEKLIEDDEGNEFSLMDFLCDDSPSALDNYINLEAREKIKKIVENLNDKDKKIIEMRFGFYGDKIYTQKEVANELGCTQTYISKRVRVLTKKIKSQFDKN